MDETIADETSCKERLTIYAWRWLNLGLLALGLAACCHTPPAGKVALVSDTTYAVYYGAGLPVQVEDTRTVKNRWITPIGRPPTGSASSASSPASPACPSGTVALRPGTVWAEYFGVADLSKQLEDVRAVTDRCIVDIPPTVEEVCPPGYREKIIQGNKYCVPAP